MDPRLNTDIFRDGKKYKGAFNAFKALMAENKYTDAELCKAWAHFLAGWRYKAGNIFGFRKL